MYVCMYVCMWNWFSPSVCSNGREILGYKIRLILGLYPEIALTTSGLRNRSYDHEHSSTAHWLLLNPDVRRPSLRAVRCRSYIGLCIAGCYCRSGPARIDDGVPWYCYWRTRHRLTNEDCVRVHEALSVWRSTGIWHSYKQHWHIGTQWVICVFG